MKLTVVSYRPVAYWRWQLKGGESQPSQQQDSSDLEDEVCGVCRNAFESCCPECKRPGDDCPLIFGQCSHVFHMHCLLKSESSKNACPLDRRPWQTAEQKSVNPATSPATTATS